MILLILFVVFMALWGVGLIPAAPWGAYSGWCAFLAVLCLGLRVFGLHT